MRKRIIFCVFLIITALIPISFVGQTVGQSDISIELQGATWPMSTINILIIPSTGEDWWNPDYINSTLRAIGQWNLAIQTFASENPDFGYLSSLRLAATLAGSGRTNYDVNVSWVRAPASNAVGQTGLTTTWSENGIIINSTISLSANDGRGYQLNGVDTQNVAVHELGHVLGLGHCSYSGDVMFATYGLGSGVRALSTLDLYGVSLVFGWLKDYIRPGSDLWPAVREATLPSNIDYSLIDIGNQNLPPSSPIESFLKGIGRALDAVRLFVVKPEGLAVIVLAVLAVLTIALVYPRRKDIIKMFKPARS